MASGPFTAQYNKLPNESDKQPVQVVSTNMNRVKVYSKGESTENKEANACNKVTFIKEN